MPRVSSTLVCTFLVALSSSAIFSFVIPASARPPRLTLRTSRTSARDLEVAGDLAGLPRGSIRYLTREDLRTLPQLTYTVSDDANLTAPTKISGISLDELRNKLAASPDSDMVVAICVDRYRASYPRDYLSAHRPLLVLLINGQPPDRWPKDSKGLGLDMGPYLISHPKFTPSFKILSHADEPQVPWGVIRLEFRDQQALLGAIAPQGPRAQDAAVQAGYKIAQQNCFRCHNLRDEGGQKSGRPWTVLATWANALPDYFASYIRNPKSKNAKAEMPGFPAYDDATIAALNAYFRTFAESAASKSPPAQKAGR
ncbi:MAG TPA: c-type cytochrome [Candidatus Eisenbacteria bacterium]|jgi:mono/diheme cytochrome c family protein|nr:c-type cytochrome [Candidatus Eisenbacteria bacterium]